MKRALSILLACILAALMVVGCNQTPSSTSTPTTSSGTTASGQTTAPTTTPQSDVPEYLNLDSTLPVVKDGYDIPLTIAVRHSTDFGKPEDTHFWNFVKEKMNIDYKVEQVFNRDEYVNLTFAADTLPDLMISMNITPQLQMIHGVQEKQLLGLSSYINEDMMPNLTMLFEEYPDYPAQITAPNGEIYSFPYIRDSVFDEAMEALTLNQQNINTVWLEEAGLQLPTTLDEFTAIMAAFKARGDNVVPMGGSVAYGNPLRIFLNAFGYKTNDPEGLQPALRNDEVVIPAADREAFGAVLEVIHDYYTKGYIHQDFYTLDETATKALASQGLVGFMVSQVYLTQPQPELFQQYTTIGPLTSDHNDEKFTISTSMAVSTGGCVISSKTEYPEAAIRFCDYFFTAEGTNMAWVGAHENSENLLEGWGGWYLDEGYSRLDRDRIANPDLYPNAVEYLRKRVAGWDWGVFGVGIRNNAWRAKTSGLEPRYNLDIWKDDPTNGDYWPRVSQVENLKEYVEYGFPTILFFNEDENVRIVELSSVINAHIESECAKFVTGARALSEIDAYFNELDALGLEEYLGYYKTAYENYLANQ
ncbi:MAG: extracellular solute-binding protein [Clostridiales bacterium]|nr:extracellular solute-binding protein [Clostridiales bacterium]